MCWYVCNSECILGCTTAQGVICQRRHPGEGVRHIFAKAGVFPGILSLMKLSCISSSATPTSPDTALRHAGSPFSPIHLRSC